MASTYFEGAELISGPGLTWFQGFKGVVGLNCENVAKTLAQSRLDFLIT